MAATIQTVRKLALAMPDVEEGVSFGTTAFYLRNKLMLRLREDGETLVVKFPIEKRKEAIDRSPDIFSVSKHYQNYPVILISLLAVDSGLLRELIESAWRMLASKRQITAFENSSI